MSFLSSATNIFKGMVNNTADKYIKQLQIEVENPDTVKDKADEFVKNVKVLTEKYNMLDVVYSTLKEELEKMEDVLKKQEKAAASVPMKGGKITMPKMFSMPKMPSISKIPGVGSLSKVTSAPGAAAAAAAAAAGTDAAAASGAASGAAPVDTSGEASAAFFSSMNKELVCQVEKTLYTNKDKTMQKFKDLFIKMDYSYLRAAVKNLEDNGAKKVPTTAAPAAAAPTTSGGGNKMTKKRLSTTSHRRRHRAAAKSSTIRRRHHKAHFAVGAAAAAARAKKKRNRTISSGRNFGRKNITFRNRHQRSSSSGH